MNERNIGMVGKEEERNRRWEEMRKGGRRGEWERNMEE
jgi:hypothetical protein